MFATSTKFTRFDCQRSTAQPVTASWNGIVVVLSIHRRRFVVAILYSKWRIRIRFPDPDPPSTYPFYHFIRFIRVFWIDEICHSNKCENINFVLLFIAAGCGAVANRHLLLTARARANTTMRTRALWQEGNSKWIFTVARCSLPLHQLNFNKLKTEF